MKGLLETTRANFSFSDRRRSNQPRKPLPRQQSFLLEPLESRLLLSVTPTFVGTPTLIDGPDVNITQRGGVQAEEAIAINPTNPANIIAAPNDGPGINGTPSRDSVWVSQDAGANWTRVTIPIPAAGTMSHGDPTIVFDGTGRAVYAHLVDTTADHKGPHFVATAASTDGGLNWTASNVDGPAGVDDDKEYLAVGPDRLNPGQERFYIAWDRHDLGNVIFTSSSADGINWSAPVQVDPGTDRIDTHMAVGGDGTVYLFFQDAATADHSDIMFSRSVDDGANWSAPVNIHTTNINPFDSTFSGGRYTIPAQPDRGTWPSLSVDIDRSGGPFDGRLYVSFTDSPGDSPAADHNNTNVFVMTSDDGGTNWSTPVMVNDDSGTNSQFMSWLAVDQTTGFVGVSWHDARNDTGSGAGDTDGVPNTDTQMWGTVSVDGGAHFLPNIQISAGTSNGGDAGTFNYGDYTGLTFFGSSLFPAWADNSNSTGNNPDGALSRMDTYTSRATLQWSGGEIVNMFGDSDFLNEDDTFKIVLDASGTFIEFFENGTLKFTATESVVTQINAFGFGGNDTLIVDSSNGLINVANGIRYNGGNGFDKLSLLQTGGTTQNSDTYSVGAIPGAGTSIIGGPSGTQTVFFEDLAPVLDLVPAQSLTVNATPANNAISYLVGPTNTNNGLVTIDDQEPIEFSKKVTLTINAKEGSDTISLNNPNTPTSLSEIFINGGDPSGVDTLSVTGGGDVTYIPTAFDGGILELTSSPVKINGIEVLSYDGQGSNGSLTIVGTSGDDTIVHTPGGNDQAGTFQVNSLLALSYQNLGSVGSLTADGAGGTDTLVYNGTAANDSFTIGTAGQVNLNSRLVLNTANVEVLTLEGLDGDDTFTLVPAISASVYSTINLNGGGQASATGDRVYLVGTAGDDSIKISGQVVSLGGKTINGSGIEDIHLDASGGNDLITYNGVTGVTEKITVSSSGVAGGGQISVPGVTLVDFVGVGHIAVNGNTPTPTETDTLTFAGTNANDTFNINLAATGSATDPVLTLKNNGTTLLTLDNYTNFNTLKVLGLDGADTFNVNTSDGPISRNLFVDGGLPSGKNKSTDILNIFYTPPRPKIIQSAATQDPDAGFVDLQYDTARFVVQYDDVEQVPPPKRR